MQGSIVFSLLISFNAIIRITPNSVWIHDAPEMLRNFGGGSDEFDILVEDTDIGKKKRKMKKITIRKKLPVCPITMLPIPEKEGFKFKSGFALNCHSVIQIPHRRFGLRPAYYCKIFEGNLNIYLIPKITACHKMASDVFELLSNTINTDIALLIREKYDDMFGRNFDFRMLNPPVDTTHIYHKQAMRQLVDEGKLDLGVANIDPLLSNNIMAMTLESFNYIYPNGWESHSKTIFGTYERMMDSRQRYIERFL